MEEADKFYADLEATGEREVRQRLAFGHYGTASGETNQRVVSWLFLKDNERAQALANEQIEAAKLQASAAERQGLAADRQAVAADRQAAAAESQAASAERMAGESITANRIARIISASATLAVAISIASLIVSIAQCSQQHPQSITTPAEGVLRHP